MALIHTGLFRKADANAPSRGIHPTPESSEAARHEFYSTHPEPATGVLHHPPGTDLPAGPSAGPITGALAGTPAPLRGGNR